MAHDGDEVVISGLAGCFPGSDNVDELRDNLFDKVDLVNEENCRWNKNSKLGVPNSTGKIRKAAKFDAAHFGIHRKQVLSLDPMTCLVLERSFEAICDAGISPPSLKGRNVGVYMGSTFSEADNVFDYEAAGDGFGIMGHNRSMLATRISYYLDISGPSCVALTSWCSGLTALTQAYRDLKTGRCEAAIVGSPNLTLFPVMSWHLAQLGLLSPDGKCRVFDKAANGYGRSDSIVVMYLQRSSDAKRIYANVVHSKTTCYGGRPSFARPAQFAISQLLQEFYRECKIDKNKIAYLEADSAGSMEGDKIELNAVEEVLLEDRQTPLLIGSVKSNLGHTEAASGLVGLTKILLMMQSQSIPPNLHYHQPAPDIPALADGRLKVVTEKTKWPGGLAAVTSIGIDGTYSHALVQSFDKEKKRISDGLPRLLAVSARTEAGVHEMISKVKQMPFDAEYIRLLQDVHQENIVGHIFRGFSLLGGPQQNSNITVEHFPGQKRPLWFIYSGMGSQWAGMGVHLMQLPIFRESIEKSHAILKCKDIDLISIITSSDSSVFDKILHCFVGIAAIQIALTDVLRELGIKPDGIIGHSVGELGCAYADECLTAEEMILSAYARGIASTETKLIKGTMAAVGLGYSEIKDKLPPGIEVACHNGPGSCTISGPADNIELYVKDLQSRGIFARSVNVANIAYHSQYIAPAAPRLLELLKEIIPDPKPRSHRWVSTSVPEHKWDTQLAKTSSAEYHTNNLLSSVLFEEGSAHIPRNTIAIEIAPHGLLQAILRKSLGPTCSNVSLTQRGNEKGLEFLLTAIGKLHVLGLQPKVSNLYPQVEFPVSRGTPSISSILTWEHSEDWPIANVLENDLIAGEKTVTLSMSHEEVRAYTGHSVNNNIVFPAFGYLKMVWELLASIIQEKFVNLPVVFENLRFHESVIIPDRGSMELYMLLQRGSGEFEVMQADRKKVLVTGIIYVPENVDKEFTSLPVLPKAGSQLTADDVYTEFTHRGYQYSGLFKSIKSIVVNETGSVSKTAWHNNWVAFITSMIQQSMLQTGEYEQTTQMPLSIQRLVINPTKHQSNETEFEIVSDLSTGMVQGGGVQMQGLHTRALPTTSSSPDQEQLRLNKLKFISHTNPKLNSVKEFVNVCIQIAVVNSPNEVKNKKIVTVIETKGQHPLVPQIEESIRQFPHIEVSAVLSKDIMNPAATKSRTDSFLVVTSSDHLDGAINYLGISGGFILTRVDHESAWKGNDELVTIAQQKFPRGDFLLLKKINRNAKHVEEEVIKVTNNTEWIAQMRKVVKEGKKRVLLVVTGEPKIGVTNFMRHIYQEQGQHLIRCVLVIDNSAPKFDLAANWYQDQLKKNLIVNVYQKKSWGSVCHLAIGEDRSIAVDQVALPLPSLSLQGVDLNYLGLNRKDNKNECELGHVDFSGRSGASRWVMGMARAGATKPDPLLMWPVPESWSMEDATTIPLAYATAYYALNLVSNIQSGQRVLIHSGCSSIGQAAIAVALNVGCTVFTSVENNKQVIYLTKRFPKLSRSNIYILENNNFETKLLTSTKGKGVQCILNNLSGKVTQASLRCLASHGHFIQLGQADLDKNSILGMHMFLRSTTFYGIASNNLFNASEKWKKQLHALVQGGIDSGVVQPLELRVFLHQQYDRALGLLSDESQWCKVILNVREANRASNYLQADIIPRLACDPNGTYLIVGGSTELWVRLADWLLQRGVQKLVIAQQIEPPTNFIIRRVGLMRKYYNTTIELVKSDLAKSTDGANKLLEYAHSLGPLTAIFTLPLMNTARETEQNGLWVAGSRSLPTIQNLDSESRSFNPRHFVCISCEGADSITSLRHQVGLPGISVQWDTRRAGTAGEMDAILATLDRLVGVDTEHAIVVSPVCNRQSQTNNSWSDISAQLNSFLPPSVADLARLGADLLSPAALSEVTTLSPSLRDVKEVPPLFLLPGLQGPSKEALRLLSRRLMYPAVCVKLPRTGAIQDMAAEIAKNVRTVQPSGPYNIVGESWSGALSLELAKCLEASGEKTQLFILEGAPETVKAAFQQLGEGVTFQTNLICKLLSISSAEIRENLLAQPSWEARLSYALSNVSFASDAERRNVETAITTLHSHINALIKFQPGPTQLTGLVTLIRPLGEEEDTCGLLKFCKNTVTVRLVGRDRDAMLSSLQTSDTIGDSVIL